jgi:hypothetical protein
MARYLVYASAHAVAVYEGDRRVTYRHGDFSDPADPHGVSRDEADDAAEQLGYLIGTWRWAPDERGQDLQAYKAVAASSADPAHQERAAADRAAGQRNQAAVNLQIARTGKRPSGKPLTAEQRQWVSDYQAGKRDF